MPLTAAQALKLQTLVQPAAWNAHNALPPEGQVDVDAAFGVYALDYTEFIALRLTAADVLETAGLASRVAGAALGGGIKREKLDVLEVEHYPAASGLGVSADAWLARAEQLRHQVQASLGTPTPIIVPWGVSCPE